MDGLDACWDELLLDAVQGEARPGVSSVLVLAPVAIGERGGARRKGGIAGRARSCTSTRDWDAEVDADASLAFGG